MNGRGSLDELTWTLSRSLALVMATVAIGIIGYTLVGWPEYGFLDAVYMTVITLTTVGYGEVIDLTDHPGGRVFTIILLVLGVGSFLNFVSALTAFWVEGHHFNLLWRRRMNRELSHLSDHIVVCGAGHTGAWICRELVDTHRPLAAIEHNPETARGLADVLGTEIPVLIGDAMNNEVLVQAGVERATSVVCCVSSDKDNLIVALSARILNPKATIIARCIDEQMEAKILQAGADRVVSPNRIGGLRMVSEAVRPGAVDYIDRMLREGDAGLRVESTTVHAGSVLEGQTVAVLRARPGVHLLAMRRGGEWKDDLVDDDCLCAGDQLIYTSSFDLRQTIEREGRGR